MRIQVGIKDHLLVPFARPKWDISKIKMIGVSTKATYFESETPCAYIDKTRDEALRLVEFPYLFPEQMPKIEDNEEALSFIRDYLKSKCELQTEAEKHFLDLYFRYCWEIVQKRIFTLSLPDKITDALGGRLNDSEWVFQTLLPLPQAHLYVADPLQDKYTYAPKNMFRVDFAFWTGKRIIAVEIDGSSHVGSPQHVRKDRLLQRADVTVIHILNSELMKYQQRTIKALLPQDILNFWETVDVDWSTLVNPIGDGDPWRMLPE